MPERINTRVISETRSGRVAVLARYRPHMPWVQVDSCVTMREANVEAARLEGNPKLRGDTIDEWTTEIWGKDAPVTPPAES
jgi:hypothetical protein